MIRCHSCEFDNLPRSNYCRRCGNSLEEVTVAIEQENYPKSPPEPYSWKEDEVGDVDERGVRQRSRPPEAPTPPVRVGGGGRRQPEMEITGVLARQHQGLFCPYCGGQMAVSPIKKVSGAGWLTFVLLLIFVFPLAWIGLLIRKDVAFCLSCDATLDIDQR
jgi:hypothetical protein